MPRNHPDFFTLEEAATLASVGPRYSTTGMSSSYGGKTILSIFAGFSQCPLGRYDQTAGRL